MDKLTNEMIVALANDLGLEPALLKAVQLDEGAGRDRFLVDGRPQILFEGHIMYKEIKNKFGLDKSVAAQKSYYLVDSLSDDAEPEQADFDFAHMLLVY